TDIVFYEKDYLKLNPTLHEEDIETKFKSIVKALNVLRLKCRNIEIIADIGCGSCKLLIKILDYMHKNMDSKICALGIDVSFQILSIGEKHPNLIKLRTDAEKIPLENNSISLSLCIDIIEHINHPDLFLKEIARISQFAIFKIPLELCFYTTIKGGKQRLTKLKNQYGHIHHFNRNSIMQLVNEHFYIIYEDYEKIPNRAFFFDKMQEILLVSNLHHMFAFMFGGFIILLAKSRQA
ncbi:MAG: class I SAM-dependent methyltransferase, partial [bacterium]